MSLELSKTFQALVNIISNIAKIKVFEICDNGSFRLWGKKHELAQKVWWHDLIFGTIHLM